LDRIGFLRHPCDFDLLVFFVRHRRVLVTSEHISLYLGYDLKRIGESLEGLIAANVVTRSQSQAHAARLYVFAGGETSGDWLPPLLDTVSTREGRLAMRQAMREPRGGSGRAPIARVFGGMAKTG
jgi:hypothetical protein